MRDGAFALTAYASQALSGTLEVPGDKSLSHRALILAALAVGESRITGLLEGEDVRATAAALGALGAEMTRDGPGLWRVVGRGVGGLCEPETVLDLANAGTGARLLMGVIAGHPMHAVMTGDASLRSRPMERVATPLRAMGVEIALRAGGRLPAAIRGTAEPLPLEYRLPVPSAQVKSAILLAGLSAPGVTRIVEPVPTRDHSERLLGHFGADIAFGEAPDGARQITLAGQAELFGREVAVPADPSSAAFPAVAALIVPGSRITMTGVGVNPQRIGLYRPLAEMGAGITLTNERQSAGEPVADLVVESRPLSGVEVPPERAASMIDEYPILAVAAASAAGRTVMRGLSELRVKESDRLRAIARGLAACGVAVEEGTDSLAVTGAAGPVPGGAIIASELDHRIAMSFLVLGLAARKAVTIDDGRPIATSFPRFAELMSALGARIEGATGAP
jgi:3-phosphoshikimate 1-carboxyvinyltransferase